MKKNTRKYLHVEIMCGNLYVYLSDTKGRNSELKTVEDLDNECDIGPTNVKRAHTVILMNDLKNH